MKEMGQKEIWSLTFLEFVIYRKFISFTVSLCNLISRKYLVPEISARIF